MDRQPAAYKGADENDKNGTDPETETSVEFIVI
jgi:hypothetical protein